jgi:hypothetical protein
MQWPMLHAQKRHFGRHRGLSRRLLASFALALGRPWLPAPPASSAPLVRSWTDSPTVSPTSDLSWVRLVPRHERLAEFSGPVDFALGLFRVDVPGRHLQAVLCGQDAGGLPDPAAGGSGGGAVAPGSVKVGQGCGADAVRLAAR